MWFSDLANKYALCGVPNSKSYLSSSRPAAPPPTKPTSLVKNDKVIVTEWSFEVGDSTGQHKHQYNYVVVPMLDGELKIIDKENKETISKLSKGVAYYRDKGVEHNVFNNNNFPYSFIEVEMVD